MSSRQFCIAVGAIVALLIALQAGRQWLAKAERDSHDATCKHHLKLLRLYLSYYHDVHGHFPPAYVCDADGAPVNSWRTSIVHYTWYNFANLEYDLSQPWDGPANAQFGLDQITIREFQCPRFPHATEAATDFVAVVGPDTLWPGCDGATMAADGADADTILLLELPCTGIRWMEPRDVTIEEALDAILEGDGCDDEDLSQRGISYLTAGGEVGTLDRNMDRESLRRRFLRASAR